MLLSRLFGWFRRHNTFGIFMLEILAVFIGITGSLFVDNWREQRSDYESADNELRTLNFELRRALSNTDVLINLNNDALESTVLLAFGDTGGLDDAELLRHFWRTTWIPFVPATQFNLKATNANLSIPFNDDLALIESTLHDLRDFDTFFRSTTLTLSERTVEMIDTAGLVASVTGAASGIKYATLVDEAIRMYELTGEFGGKFVANEHNLERIRSAVDDPVVRAQLRQLITFRQLQGISIIALVQAERDAIDAIQRFAPGISVPFVEVGIDGSATGFGWQTYLAMQQDRDNPAVWRITLDLIDGEVKFRADQAWAVNWGSSVSEAVLGTAADAWSYVGDVDRAFPRGTAILNGNNIPVRAGRYEITFDTDTLAYSFNEVPAQD